MKGKHDPDSLNQIYKLGINSTRLISHDSSNLQRRDYVSDQPPHKIVYIYGIHFTCLKVEVLLSNKLLMKSLTTLTVNVSLISHFHNYRLYPLAKWNSSKIVVKVTN